MRHNKMAPLRDFNPVNFRSDMHQLASEDPKSAADVATLWRERFHNMAVEAAHITGFLAELAMTSGSAGLMAYWDGLWDAEREEIQRQWNARTDINGGLDEAGNAKISFEDAGVDDPAKILGIVDTNLGITIFAGLATAFKFLDFSKMGRSKYYDLTPVARSIAIGGTNQIISEITRNYGLDSKRKEIATAAAEGKLEQYKFSTPAQSAA